MNLPKNRWLAFASHFGMSLIIFAVLLLLIVLFWYPGALFSAAGGWQGVRIVIGVDLILGPLLTLIVYDLAKPRKILFRDLSIIALIQLSCLSVGVYVVFKERPIAVTYAYDKFYALKRSDFVKSGNDPDSMDLNLMTPNVFYTEFSQLAENSGIDAKTFKELNNRFGKNLVYRTELYMPFPKTINAVGDVFIDNKLPKFNEHRAGCITVELITAYEQGIACYDVKSQQFEKFISINELQTQQLPEE